MQTHGKSALHQRVSDEFVETLLPRITYKLLHPALEAALWTQVKIHSVRPSALVGTAEGEVVSLCAPTRMAGATAAARTRAGLKCIFGR